MNILIADDDERILRMLKDFFSFNKFQVTTAKDGLEALNQFKLNQIDIIILDVMMPIYDGWVVCKEIRKTSDVPIIMLTAKDGDLDELFAFDIGVDDYVSKPFNIELLLARVKRLLKNKKNIKSSENILSYKGIKIYEDKHIVTIDAENIMLSPKEYDLLVYLIKNKNIALKRETLALKVWGIEYFGDTRTIDTHVNRLRNKLKGYSTDLKTIRSFGYKLGDN